MSETIQLFLPTMVTDRGSAKLSERPTSLEGKVVGLLWNSKPNTDLLYDEFATWVKATHKVKEVRNYRKPSAAVGAGEQLLDQIKAECDVAVSAMGD